MAFAPQTIGLAERRAIRVLAPAEWWHLLSLDAPVVAVLWAWSFARVVGVDLPGTSLLLLFLGTWLVYVADRILDGLQIDANRLRERHFFYLRHRGLILLCAVPAAGLLAWLVFTQMNPVACVADCFLFAVALTYFLLIHLQGKSVERWFPKELVVALVFSAATAVPAWSRLTHRDGSLAALAVLFFFLCWLNCAGIEKWESLAESAPRFHWTTLLGQRYLQILCAAVAAASVILGAFFVSSSWIGAGLCVCAALSAVILAMLDRSRLSAFHLRIAADAALLTPLFLLLIR